MSITKAKEDIMLPDEVWKRTVYLSAHFSDKRYRDELRLLIENYIKEEHSK